MGPRSVPLWLPLPEYAGFMSRDTRAARAAGLHIRPYEGQCARHARLGAEHAGRLVTGLSREDEAAVLAAWRAAA
jgi:hypothetical protein